MTEFEWTKVNAIKTDCLFSFTIPFVNIFTRK